MSFQSLTPAFDRLIDPEAGLTRLGTGFEFTEGPIWHPVQNHLLFSDMPGDVRRQWDGSGVREILTGTYKANGMTYDHDLNLIACEHASSSLVRLSPAGDRTVLASHFEGAELNSPNDVCMRQCGSLYFTDPYFGRIPYFGVERPRELGWQGVFRVLPDQTAPAEPQLVVDRYLFSQPNGLCFSPDESLLYINDTEQANIRVFDVNTDGTLKNGRLFASGIIDSQLEGVPDGMKCDALGNVWVTAPGGLWVYDPAGRLIGKLFVPEKAANLHWGGEDWRTLFVCASRSLYAVKLAIGPSVEAFMRHSVTYPRAFSASTSDSIRRSSLRTYQVGTLSAEPSPPPDSSLIEELELDPTRCALIIQDMQNDVVSEGGAFADSGAPQHCKEQNAVANIARLAEACRSVGIPVIHVWFLCDPGHPGITLNAPLFEGLTEANALVRDTWGGAPVAGLEARPVDHVVTKSRMSAFEGTSLETILKAEGRDILVSTGAWTNMSIEHTARTGADKGYIMVVPEDGCSTMNARWHEASINFALGNVAAVTRVDAVLRALQAK